MKISNVPYGVTDWSTVTAVEHKGETGAAYWQTVEAGNLRVGADEGYKTAIHPQPAASKNKIQQKHPKTPPTPPASHTPS